MKKVAITGGIGSGKSTVVKILKQAGYPVYSCDEIYRDIIKTQEYIQEVQALFPNVVENGEIKLELLARTVFGFEENRKKLNAIAHPKIMQALQRKMNETNGEVVFAEVPLLFEGGYEQDFDERIVVMRPLKDKIQAVCQRDKTDVESVQARMRSQFDYEAENVRRFLESKNAILIDNDGTEEDLQKKIFSILTKIL